MRPLPQMASVSLEPPLTEKHTEVIAELCEIAQRRTGINLRAGKEALVASRVSKRLRALDILDPLEYLRFLKSDTTGEELVHFLDVISTNVTGFFREHDHFDRLAHLVRGWIAAGRRRLRLWSAACSTGEEPYTMAMVIEDVLKGQPLDYLILATDLSRTVLERAEVGWYTPSSLQNVPAAYRERFFQPEARDDGSQRVSPKLKDRIVFKRINLAVTPFPMNGPLDVVFCRNVMIYFGQEVRQPLVSEIERLLAPDGVLFTSHSETLAGLQTQLKAVLPSIFLRRAGDADPESQRRYVGER
jgi:chemotaxis protein methyltransferase CheR